MNEGETRAEHIDPALAAHLAGGVTTLANCWRLIRRDGTVQGFTDHDRDLAFDGTTFAARSGLGGAQATSELGLAVAASEVAAASVRVRERNIGGY